MRTILTIGSEDYLMPTDANLDELLKIAEQAVHIKKDYGKSKWRESGRETEFGIKIIADSAFITEDITIREANNG